MDELIADFVSKVGLPLPLATHVAVRAGSKAINKVTVATEPIIIPCF